MGTAGRRRKPRSAARAGRRGPLSAARRRAAASCSESTARAWARARWICGFICGLLRMGVTRIDGRPPRLFPSAERPDAGVDEQQRAVDDRQRVGVGEARPLDDLVEYLEDGQRRGGGHPRLELAGGDAEVVGDGLGERLLRAQHEPALVGEEVLVVLDDAAARAQLLLPLALLGEPRLDPAAQRGRRRLAGGTHRQAPLEALDPRFAVGERELLLVREVARDRAGGDVGGGGDLRDRRLVEALTTEELQGGAGDRLPRPAALALAKAGCVGFDRHRLQRRPKLHLLQTCRTCKL